MDKEEVGRVPSEPGRPRQRFYDRAEKMNALVWRLCEYRRDHCDRCPATTEIAGHGACKNGCRALAEEMAALVMASCDSDGSPKDGDACGSVEDDSAGPKDIAQ